MKGDLYRVEGEEHMAVRKIFRTIVVLGLALICAVPLYYVIVSSFKTSIDMIKNLMFPVVSRTDWIQTGYCCCPSVCPNLAMIGFFEKYGIIVVI